jgi:hypothetical protein
MNKRKVDFQMCFESFGVRIMVESNSREAIDNCKQIVARELPQFHTVGQDVTPEHTFTLIWNESRRDTLYKNADRITVRTNRKTVLGFLAQRIRLTVAEHAKGRVFIHAGVVAWKGKAIVIPGGSMYGKTSLVVELVKHGALYYSDEYAVIDEFGFVHPFAKTLSVREIGDYRQVEYSAESFGGMSGREPVRVAIVLFTRFRPKAKWRPKQVVGGQRIFKLIRDTIPIRNDPARVLHSLRKLADGAVFLQSDRGEASQIAASVLGLIDEQSS